MAIHFKYKTVKRPDGSYVRTPSIPITLMGRLGQIDSIALIDSGADISAISEEFAELLGLDLDNEIDSAYGIGGKVDSIETFMTILIEKGHESYNIGLPVKVILGGYDFPILLGRNGFFDKFIISFDESKQRVSLKKVQQEDFK